MSRFDKSHRPERDLAEKSSSPTGGAQRGGGAEVDAVTVHDEARLWRGLGATHAPQDEADAASIAVEHRGAGSSVDSRIAGAVSAQTGTDVQNARVHSDPLSQQSAHAMQARAFAYGNDVFLGPGESASDTALMAHELTHVAQQRGGSTAPQRKLTVGDANSAAETHADAVAAKVVAGAPPSELLVDEGALTDGQMMKAAFLEQLKAHVTAAANDELGRLGSALACPFIAEYFLKYSAMPASATQTLIRKWIPSAAGVTSAIALMPLVPDHRGFDRLKFG